MPSSTLLSLKRHHLKSRLLQSTILAMGGLLLGSADASANCTLTTAPNVYTCAGTTTTTQFLVAADNASITTAPGYSVTSTGSTGLLVFGNGAKTYTDTNASVFNTSIGDALNLVTGTDLPGTLSGLTFRSNGTFLSGSSGVIFSGISGSPESGFLDAVFTGRIEARFTGLIFSTFLQGANVTVNDVRGGISAIDAVFGTNIATEGRTLGDLVINTNGLVRGDTSSFAGTSSYGINVRVANGASAGIAPGVSAHINVASSSIVEGDTAAINGAGSVILPALLETDLNPIIVTNAGIVRNNSGLSDALAITGTDTRFDITNNNLLVGTVTLGKYDDRLTNSATWNTANGFNEFGPGANSVTNLAGATIIAANDPSLPQTTTFNGLGTFTNAGLIVMQDGLAGDNTVITGNYIGQGGTISFDTFLGADASPSDILVLNGGSGSGNSLLSITNTTGGGALTVADGILVVDAQNGATTTTDAFSLGNRVAAGAYEYGLFRGGVSNANSWFLRSTLLPPPPPPPPGPPPPPPPPNYRPEVPTDMVLPVLANRLGLNMIGTYRDRFGEDYPDPAAPAEPVFCKDPAQNYRCTPTAEQAGVYAGATPRKMAAWGRIFGETGERDFGSDDLVGSLNGFLDNGPSYDIHVWGLQAGMDLWRKQHEDGSRDIGGFYLSYGRATADVNGVYGGDAGSAEMNAYALGGYWTHIGAPGWYVDAVLQGTRYDQADTTSVLGESFDTEGWGIAASLEGGYPFVLGQGWTIEPQAQLVYQHVTLDDGADSFGLIGFDDSDALYGRLGGRLARNWMTENNRHMTAWLSANVWSSFGADATTTFAGLSGANIVALDADLGGTWGSFGLGLSAEVADNVRLFASGDYNIGFDDGDSWSVGGRVGLKVVW